jgi:predicted PurR-regulated permease PerM
MLSRHVRTSPKGRWPFFRSRISAFPSRWSEGIVANTSLVQEVVMSDRRSSKPRAEPAVSDRRQPLPANSQARMVARTALAIALIVLALWIAADFLPALGWAAIIAITAWPLYVRSMPYLGETRSPILAPLIFTALIAAIVFVPLALGAHQIARQGDATFTWIAESRKSGIAIPSWVAQLPIAADTVRLWWEQNLSDPAAAASWFKSINAEKATEWTRALGGQLLHRGFMFFLCLIALFGFLRHGAWISNRLMDTADRILGDPGERLASKMVSAVRGTVNGTVLVAFAEGLLIGIAYLLAGVPNPVLFTLLTIAFAMVPFGAWAAFSVASVTLLISDGNLWPALAVFGWGAAVMLGGDHFVWPTLVGNAARLPFLVALIGIFGGLQVFGLIGLFVGPVIMAALLTVWREWLVGADDRNRATR